MQPWFPLLLTSAVALAGGDGEAAQGGDQLEFVVVMYRHGDRTPIDMFPTDPYKDPSNWPVGFGQLTPRGKQMQYHLGQYLRGRYDALLGDKYSEKVIYVRSTDVDRTLMSAQSNLAGLYPPLGDQVWNAKLLWQPIPVHTLPLEEDNLLTRHAVCPTFQRLYDQLMQSDEIRAIDQEHKWLYDYLTEKTGQNVTNMNLVNFVFDTLFIEELYNKTLPDWTKEVYPAKMDTLRSLSFTLTTWNHELARLRSGPLLDNLVQTFRQVEKGTMDPPERKMFMYSGHDTTLSSFLNSLGLFDPPISPPYASLVAVELRRDVASNQRFVEITYRNDSSVPPYLLRLPGCQARCPLDDFDRLTRPLRPADWRAECGLPSAGAEDVTVRVVTLASLAVGVVLVALIVVAVTVRCLRRRFGDGNRGYASLNQDVA